MAKSKSALARAAIQVVDAGPRPTEHAFGGGLEGASRTSRELATFRPMLISPDQQIALDKAEADVRGRDTIQNDGYITGALQTHRDSIVGAKYMLNAQPDWEMLTALGVTGATEAWAESFQTYVEAKFNLLSDAQDNWFDASRQNTLTGLLRLAIGSFFMTGEVLASVEWIRQYDRPFNTAIQLISPTRLSNPDGLADNIALRRGKVIDTFGQAQGYWIQNAYPTDPYGFDAYLWKLVPARKPWGRVQMIHIYEGLQPGQSRGIADIVSVLKECRMTSKFQDVVLQNAVVNATYAAAIESELPSEVVFAAMGAGQLPGGVGGLEAALGQYMTALQAYIGTSTNIGIDGVKMPHLFPGTKLNMKPMGTPGGVGTDYESSLLRHIAAPLGISYEQLTKDFSKTNYSSFRGAVGESWKFMSSRKKLVADGMANTVYGLWLEEEINDPNGNIPLPSGWNRGAPSLNGGGGDFYDATKRAALLAGTWIGASKGQVDEMKETQAAILRIDSGLSTYEDEIARLGGDWRKVFRQRAREEAMMKSLNLTFDTTATKPTSDNGPEDPATADAPAPSPAPKPAPKKKVVKA